MSIEVDVILDVSTLEEHVFEDPEADGLVEALEQSCTDRHDSLKIPNFKGYCGDDSIQFYSIFS